MPVTTLVPFSTTVAQMTPFPGGSAASVLSDGSDATDVRSQFSSSEPQKICYGVGPGAITQLPVGAGKVNSVTFKIRGSRDSGDGSIQAGEQGGATRVDSGLLTSVDQTFTGAPVVGVWTHAAQVNALGWFVQGTWGILNGMQIFIRDTSWDVDYNFKVQGGRAMFLSLLIASALGGRLAAVGLEEMPAIAREVRRLSPTLILPREYAQAWREMREDPRPRTFILNRWRA